MNPSTSKSKSTANKKSNPNTMYGWRSTLPFFIIAASSAPYCDAFVPASLTRTRTFTTSSSSSQSSKPSPSKPLYSYLDSLSNYNKSEDLDDSSNSNTDPGSRGSFTNTTTSSASLSSYALPDPNVNIGQESKYQSYADSLSSSIKAGNANTGNDNAGTGTSYNDNAGYEEDFKLSIETLLEEEENNPVVETLLDTPTSVSDTTYLVTDDVVSDNITDDVAMTTETVSDEFNQEILMQEEEMQVELSTSDDDQSIDAFVDVEVDAIGSISDTTTAFISDEETDILSSSSSYALEEEEEDNELNTIYYQDEIEEEIEEIDDYDYEEEELQIVFSEDEDKEEAVTSTITNTLTNALSVSASSSYLASRLSLRESKNKNEKRLSRSVYEIEKSEEAIRMIQLRAEEQIQRAEKELDEKLTELQGNLDNEIERISKLLRTQIQYEKNRESELMKLVWTLQAAKIAKQEDILADDKTTAEMMELRTKMEDSTISSQLDVVIAQKQALGAIDRCQMDDLNELISETRSILKETRSTIEFIEETLDRVVPLTAGEKVFDFSDLTNLENLWKKSSDDMDRSEVKVRALKEKYDSNRLNKLMLLGEPIPPSLEPVVKKIEATEDVEETPIVVAVAEVVASSDIDQSSSTYIEPSSEIVSSSTEIVSSSTEIIPSQGKITVSPVSKITPPVNTVNELSTKDEKELVGVIATSVGKAAIASARAGVFGIKALLETLNEDEVTTIAKGAIEKSKDISKVSSGLTESVKKMNSVKSKDDLKFVVDSDLKDGIKSTGDTLSDFGKAGKAIMNKVGSASSASQVSKSLQETSDDLVQAFNAVTALSMKSLKQNKGSDSTKK